MDENQFSFFYVRGGHRNQMPGIYPFFAAEISLPAFLPTFESSMKSSLLSPPYKIALLIILVLGVVYAISRYTKNHETNKAGVPTLKETIRTENGSPK
ncbi:MAG TPA: hypothetical protein VEY10_04830 [Flavisolibacter sp.]|jgi:hypothetical protein|nr:hypothetical protein [Flavisolibacter sp.]